MLPFIKKFEIDSGEARHFFQDIFTNASDGMVLVDLHTKKFFLGNRAMCRMLGCTMRQLTKMGVLDIHPKEDLPKILVDFRRLAKREISLVRNIPVKRKNGSIFYADISTAAPISLAGGKFILGIFHDVSERVSAEEALRHSEERFKNLANLLPQTIFETDKRGRLTYVNQQGYKIFGYTEKDLARGLHALDMIAPADRRRAASVMSKGMKSGISSFNEYAAIKKDGSIFPSIVYSNYSSFDHQQAGLRGIVVDITDLKRAQRVLRETAVKDEALLSSIADGVIAVNVKGKIILYNKAAEKMLGWKSDEVLGKPWPEILIKQDDKGKIIPYQKSEFYAALANKISTNSITPHYYVRRDGTRFPVSRAVSPVILNNKVIGAINVFRDITLERELDSAKNEFLSLASHQLRTPLSITKWVLELFVQDGELNERQKHRLANLFEANERMIALVNDLLNVARIEAGKLILGKKTLSLENLVKASFESGKINAAKRGQTIKLIFKVKPKAVKIDSLLFNEALNNLLDNAVSYSPDNDVITLTVGAKGKDYLISVNNHGAVIPEADRPKMFEKFHRSEKAFDVNLIGSGLGLFIAKAMVEANDGKIWFTSDQKHGTTFYFTVPHN